LDLEKIDSRRIRLAVLGSGAHAVGVVLSLSMQRDTFPVREEAGSTTTGWL
jgi:hypothetical protein